jgi:hypothetical protein
VQPESHIRRAFAHEAVVEMGEGVDAAAIGAAITVAVCGHWQHEPPCPLAPHFTRAERRGDSVVVRTLFVTEPAREPEVRERIGGALASGLSPDPEGREQQVWALRRAGPSPVTEDERAHAQRLGATSS